MHHAGHVDVVRLVLKMLLDPPDSGSGPGPGLDMLALDPGSGPGPRTGAGLGVLLLERNAAGRTPLDEARLARSPTCSALLKASTVLHCGRPEGVGMGGEIWEDLDREEEGKGKPYLKSP